MNFLSVTNTNIISKKCDENYPICNSCKKRDIECLWSSNRKELIQKKNFGFTNRRIIEENHSSKKGIKCIKEKKAAPNIDNEVLDRVKDKNECLTEDTLNWCPKISDIEIDGNPTNGDEHTDYIPRSPRSTMFDGMEDISIHYFEYFKARVATSVSISPINSNYFLKTFAMLAHSNQSILSALCSWGNLFLVGPNPTSRLLLIKAAIGINKDYSSFRNLQKYEFYILFNFLLIAVGIEICSGDTKNWYLIFEKFKPLISENGGLKVISKMFNDSNDIKFLILNFIFHDIMTSLAYITGSLFENEEYKELLTENKFLEMTDYGLDPLQGCIEPVYLILGDIIANSKHLRTLRQELKQLEICTLTSSRFQVDIVLYKHKEVEYLEEIHKRTEKLRQDIDKCLPNEYQLLLILEDDDELELHLRLFEVYVNVCKISLNMHIQQLPPASPEQQRLYIKTSVIVDTLIDTKMITALSLLLLLCGTLCISQYDRTKMLARLERVYRLHPIGNVKKIQELVQEYWKRNPTGKIHVDWVDICEEKGWWLPIV